MVLFQDRNELPITLRAFVLWKMDMRWTASAFGLAPSSAELTPDAKDQQKQSGENGMVHEYSSVMRALCPLVDWWGRPSIRLCPFYSAISSARTGHRGLVLETTLAGLRKKFRQ